MKLKKILAFTLGEVLITLAIVGTIASITIPSLSYNRMRSERTTKLKKFYSKMSNAIDMMNMSNMPVRYMSCPKNAQAGAPENAEDDAAENENLAYRWYLNTIDRFYNHKLLDNANNVVYFEDGASLSEFAIEDECVRVIYDTNAVKAPNRMGVDQYTFMFCFDTDSRTKYFGNANFFFGTYGPDLTSANVTDAQLENSCRQDPRTCTRFLELKNWEYPRNYPY